MRAKIRRWGNSLGLRIPKPFAEEIGVAENSSVEMSLEDGAIRIVAADRYELAELLDGVTEDNLHSEVETGPATGAEAW